MGQNKSDQNSWEYGATALTQISHLAIFLHEVDRLYAGRCPAVDESITQGYLSDLENGKRKGTLELHQETARALGVPLDLLAPVIVSEQEANPARVAKRRQIVAKMRRQRGFR